MIGEITNLAGNKIYYHNKMYDDTRAFMSRIHRMQSDLNDVMCKTPDYKLTLQTADGKHINYGNCIISELNEILDSTPWKHWKYNTIIDWSNIELELVDILHFTASIDIVYEAHSSFISPFDLDIDKDVIHSDALGLLDDILLIKQSVEYRNELSDIHIAINTMLQFAAKISSLFYVMQDDISTTDSVTKSVSYAKYECLMKIKAYSNAITYIAIITHALLINKETDNSLSKTLDRLYAIYITKNTLNKFRTDNGYGTGEYIKVWNGVEDNMVAIRLAGELGIEITMDNLYNLLVIEYANVVSNS